MRSLEDYAETLVRKFLTPETARAGLDAKSLLDQTAPATS
jgi:hypothetical protein